MILLLTVLNNSAEKKSFSPELAYHQVINDRQRARDIVVAKHFQQVIAQSLLILDEYIVLVKDSVCGNCLTATKIEEKRVSCAPLDSELFARLSAVAPALTSQKQLSRPPQ